MAGDGGGGGRIHDIASGKFMARNEPMDLAVSRCGHFSAAAAIPVVVRREKLDNVFVLTDGPGGGGGGRYILRGT